MLNKYLACAAAILGGIAILVSVRTATFSGESKTLKAKIGQKVGYIKTFGENFFNSDKDIGFIVALNNNDYGEIYNLSEELRPKHMDGLDLLVSDGFLERAVVELRNSRFRLTYYPSKDSTSVFRDNLPYGLDFKTNDLFADYITKENKKITWALERGEYVMEERNSKQEGAIGEEMTGMANGIYYETLNEVVKVLKQRYGEKYNR